MRRFLEKYGSVLIILVVCYLLCIWVQIVYDEGILSELGLIKIVLAGMFALNLLKYYESKKN